MPTIERAGARLFFEDVGEGPCLLLGHSYLCSGEMWAHQVPALGRSHRVVNLDLRGHGRSGQAESPFTLYDLVDDALAVLDHLGVEKAIWGGLSVGGMVALRAALAAPERVSALLLLDTHAGAERLVKRLRYRGMAWGVRLFGMGPLLAPVSRLMFGATTLRTRRELVAEWKGRFAALHVPSVLRFLDALVGRDSLLPRLGEIRVPVLVLVGEEDRSLPVACSQQIHRGIPGSGLEVIPEAGHLSALEQPEAVTRAMTDFLSRL